MVVVFEEIIDCIKSWLKRWLVDLGTDAGMCCIETCVMVKDLCLCEMLQ